MPYILMSKCYEYDDERYLEEEGGTPITQRFMQCRR
jgi:hypothetical protein